MTKLEILKHLPTPNDLRQHVQELSNLLDQALERLAQTTEHVNSLQQLPDLVAQQVTQALKSLEPLEQLPTQVDKALIAFDSVTKAQRDTLEDLAKEMTRQAALSMQGEVVKLDTVMVDLASQGQALQLIMKTMETSSRKLQSLPTDLAETVTHSASLLRSESKELMMAAQTVRPRFWSMVMQLALAAFLGALLVGIGQTALSRLLPESGLQQQAAWASAVWAKATEEEKRLMNQIASRRDK